MPLGRHIVILLLLSCLLPDGVRASDKDAIEFIVKRGDNLYKICEQILEDPEDWRWVAMVNRIKNPDRIMPGFKLIVPVRLLKGVPADGVVTFVKGDVSIRAKDSQEWQKLNLNQRVSQGYWLRTGSSSALEITFGDDFAVYLRPETTLEITTARKKSAFYLLYRLFLGVGNTISRIKQATGKETRFEIQTPSTVAAARGTEFRTAVDSLATTRLEVLTGKVGVRAVKTEVDVNTGEGTWVEKGKAPATPRKLLPPPPLVGWKPLYRAMPLVFEFEQIRGAASYRIMLAKDKGFKDVVKEQVIRFPDTLQVAGIEDGAYFLQSRSIDDVGLEGPALEAVEIRLRTNPPPPLVQSPADGTEYREKNVSLQWLKVGKAVKYHFQISEDPEFRFLVQEGPAVSGLSYETEGLDFKTYYFRVSSIAADGYEGIWSDTLRFTILPPPPAPPLDPPQTAGDKIHLRWRDLGESITYHFQMAEDMNFEKVLIDTRLSEPELAFERPQKVGTYYVRTSSIDAHGVEGAFSEPQTFEVDNKLLLVPAGVAAFILLLLIVL